MGEADSFDGQDLDRHHRVISVDGWFCDVCGHGSNHTTDEDGRGPEGESVRHYVVTGVPFPNEEN